MQAVLHRNQLRHALITFGDDLRHFDKIFHIVGILDIAQIRQMLSIIRRIILAVNRGQLVETLHQNACLIKLKKAHRAVHRVHAFLLGIVFNRFQQGLGDLAVVNEVDPAETAYLHTRSLVILVVDDARYTTDSLAFFIASKPILAFTHLKSMVFRRCQRIALLRLNLWHIEGIALI